MRHSLTLVTPPASEPVTLAEAKAWARIDTADDDGLLAGLIAAARQAAEEYLRRSLVTQTWRLTVDGEAGGRGEWTPGVYDLPVNHFDAALPDAIDLPRGPVQSITAVTTYDAANAAAVFAPAGYRCDPARLLLNPGYSWPAGLRTPGGTDILYTAGYGAPADVPRPIRTGLLIHAASLYEQRGLCDDAAGLPPGCLALYAPYRIAAPRG